MNEESHENSRNKRKVNIRLGIGGISSWITILVFAGLLFLGIVFIFLPWLNGVVEDVRKEAYNTAVQEMSSKLEDLKLQVQINRILKDNDEVKVALVGVLSERFKGRLDSEKVTRLAQTILEQKAYYDGIGTPIPPSLVLGILEVESNFEPRAISLLTAEQSKILKKSGWKAVYTMVKTEDPPRVHAFGAFQQLKPVFNRYARFMNIEVDGQSVFDPSIQCRITYRYLSDAMLFYCNEKGLESQDKPYLSIHSYHWGDNNTIQLIAEGKASASRANVPTLAYVQKVLMAQKSFQEIGIE